MAKHTVLVTGATKGIGRAIVDRLVADDYPVVGIARGEDPSFPGRLFTTDLADAEASAAALDSIAAEFEIGAIVNNAGIASPQALGEIDLATLAQVYDLNVRAAVQVTQRFLADLQRDGAGRIVNLVSRAIYGARQRSAYAAAKSALVGCTKTWALELAAFGVTSNAVAPGPVATELFYRARPAGSEGERAVLATVPMGRLATPDEVAAAACFLLSSDAGFITGQVLGVDGGGSLPGA